MGSFVQSLSGRFAVGGAARGYSGANCYYLPYSSPTEVDRVLDDAVSTGLTAVRTWAFLDEDKNGVQFQYWDTIRNCCCCRTGGQGLDRLDYVIAAAACRGLKLLLPLVNHWDDFGGRRSYCGWFGLQDPDDFYESAQAREAYRNWCKELVTRVNTVTGVAYRDEPAILGWELANEARCGRGVAVLRRWVDEMSQHIKQLAPNQLVGLGDEGFLNRRLRTGWLFNGSCGYDFDEFLALPAVDFGGFHLYPETWDEARSAEAALSFGRRWIEEHAEAGARIGKPVLLEEYGLRKREWREEVYGAWLETARRDGIAADLFWMLASRMDSGAAYPDYDGFTLYRDDLPASVAEHVAKVNGGDS